MYVAAKYAVVSGFVTACSLKQHLSAQWVAGRVACYEPCRHPSKSGRFHMSRWMFPRSNMEVEHPEMVWVMPST